MIYLNMIQKKNIIENFDVKTVTSGMKSDVSSSTQSDSDSRLQGALTLLKYFVEKVLTIKKLILIID